MNTKLRFCTHTAIAALLLGASGAAVQAQAQTTDQSVETVVVLGVRGAEQKAVDVKRNASSIQDSIVAEDIGKLPDTTISDSLQRITGVQIDRSAGEGGAVNIRGLPEVGTLLNGEAFLTVGSIVSVQPNFGDIPSSLFAGADVIKSPTANLLNSGITGTIDLKTRRPEDLQSGWTFAGAADATHGDVSNKFEPELSGLIGYNGGKWGLVASASYSDVTLEDSTDGMDQYGGQIAAEDSGAATSWDGIITTWNINVPGFPTAFPTSPAPGVHLMTPLACPKNGNGTYKTYQATGCAVDINGDGLSNGAFYTSENFTVIQKLVERQRLGFTTSLQADLGEGFSITADMFYTSQTQYLRQNGYQLNSASWLGATFEPLTDRDTGIQLAGQDAWSGHGDEFFTTQVYRKYLGDMETYS